MKIETMKIFTTSQIKQCDRFTIENDGITDIDLMERAASACTDWILAQYPRDEHFYIFCGNGNNGGDGFAVARQLSEQRRNVSVFSASEHKQMSKLAEINFNKAKAVSGISFFHFNELKTLPIKDNAIIIEALFGTGLNRKIEGENAEVIDILNEIDLAKISIDMPAGLFADDLPEPESSIFKADTTLSFQFWKKSFLHPETGKYCGKIYILNISLSKDFIENEPTENFVIGEELIREIYQPRNDFSHKGTFGKTAIVAGSLGKMGAAVLATKSALRSGSGLTFTHAPKCGSETLQITCPEAMIVANGKNFAEEFNFEDDQTLGIGPGLGTEIGTEKAFLIFLKNHKKPLILDADALNIISKDTANLSLIPQDSIITPHPKEFERLFGKTKNSFERLELGRKKAVELGIFIILKDHHTQVITPENVVFYNITGNSGMAKGGSGNALLGILTSLLAQNYPPKHAALFGVWLHGKAGDFAAERFSKEAMLPSDLIGQIGEVFKYLSKKNPSH